jgi:hypothetical protein
MLVGEVEKRHTWTGVVQGFIAAQVVGARHADGTETLSHLGGCWVLKSSTTARLVCHRACVWPCVLARTAAPAWGEAQHRRVACPHNLHGTCARACTCTCTLTSIWHAPYLECSCCAGAQQPREAHVVQDGARQVPHAVDKGIQLPGRQQPLILLRYQAGALAGCCCSLSRCWKQRWEHKGCGEKCQRLLQQLPGAAATASSIP